jgi:hypothetical protein
MGTGHYQDFSNSLDWGSGMLLDKNNDVCILGTSIYPNHLALTVWKINPLGEIIWTTNIRDSLAISLEGIGICHDSLNNIIVVAKISDSVNIQDYFVGKLDPSGNVLWTTQYCYAPGNYIETPSAVGVDKSGSIYVAGNGATRTGTSPDYNLLTIKLDPAGNLLWGYRYTGYETQNLSNLNLQVGKDNGIFISGNNFGPDKNIDAVIAKYDSLGRRVWIRRYIENNGKEESMEGGITLDDSSNVIGGGSAEGGSGSNTSPKDFYFMKLNGANGTTKWIVTFDTSQTDELQKVKIDTDGNIVGVGRVLYPDYATDNAVIKYSAEGDL